jgi:hypothetical protein
VVTPASYVEADRHVDCDGFPQARDHLGKDGPSRAVGTSHFAPVASNWDTVALAQAEAAIVL